MRDMLLFMCFTGLAFADLKAITYKNIHTDSDGGTWLMGNRIKTRRSIRREIITYSN